ncbi:MAG: DUF4129 domain-containing protein [bacterium]
MKWVKRPPLIRKQLYKLTSAISCVAIIAVLLIISCAALYAQTDNNAYPAPFKKLASQHNKSTKTPSEIKDSAKRILANPRFKPAPELYTGTYFEPIGKSVQSVLKFIGKIINWLSNKLFPKNAATKMGPDLSRTVVIILSALLFVFTIYALIRFRVFHGKATAAIPSLNLPTATDPPEQWLNNARGLAQDGNYREALRAAYIASLLHLDRARIILYEPKNTNWEYLRQIQKSKRTEISQTLLPLTQSFDLFWYGERPASEDDYQQFEQAYLIFSRLAPIGEA